MYVTMTHNTEDPVELPVSFFRYEEETDNFGHSNMYMEVKVRL